MGNGPQRDEGAAPTPITSGQMNPAYIAFAALSSTLFTMRAATFAGSASVPEKEMRRRALAAIDLIDLDGFESASPRELVPVNQ